MGLTLMLVVLLSPVVQPWYLSWGLVVLAPVAAGWLRRVLIILSVSAVFVGLPGGHALFHAFIYSDPLEVAGALLLLLAIFLAPLGPVARLGSTSRPERDISPQLGSPTIVVGEPAAALVLPRVAVSVSPHMSTSQHPRRGMRLRQVGMSQHTTEHPQPLDHVDD
jgi:hypothetical protein